MRADGTARQGTAPAPSDHAVGPNACRTDRLAEQGMTVSMSRRANCWDNAIVENRITMLKWDVAADVNWPTRRTLSGIEHVA